MQCVMRGVLWIWCVQGVAVLLVLVVLGILSRRAKDPAPQKTGDATGQLAGRVAAEIARRANAQRLLPRLHRPRFHIPHARRSRCHRRRTGRTRPDKPDVTKVTRQKIAGTNRGRAPNKVYWARMWARYGENLAEVLKKSRRPVGRRLS